MPMICSKQALPPACSSEKQHGQAGQHQWRAAAGHARARCTAGAQPAAHLLACRTRLCGARRGLGRACRLQLPLQLVVQLQASRAGRGRKGQVRAGTRCLRRPQGHPERHGRQGTAHEGRPAPCPGFWFPAVAPPATGVPAWREPARATPPLHLHAQQGLPRGRSMRCSRWGQGGGPDLRRLGGHLQRASVGVVGGLQVHGLAEALPSLVKVAASCGARGAKGKAHAEHSGMTGRMPTYACSLSWLPCLFTSALLLKAWLSARGPVPTQALPRPPPEAASADRKP